MNLLRGYTYIKYAFRYYGMDPDLKIFGGILIAIMLLFTLEPFYDSILQLASTSSSFIIIWLAEVYDILHVGFLFIILGLTGNEIIQKIQ